MSFLERVDQSIRRSAMWRSLFRNPYPRDERSRAYEARLPVVLQPRRRQLVECAVQRRIEHLADVLRGDVVEWLEGVFALLDGPSPAGHAGQKRLAVAVLGDER